MMFIQIEITEEKLRQLSSMADWQLRNLGINPESITSAMLKLDGLDPASFGVNAES